jgi:hypothetical protein
VRASRPPPWWPQVWQVEHDCWHVWKGTNGLYYGSRAKTSPPVVVRGEDPEDLHDMIKQAEVDRRSWWEAR